MGKSNKKVVRMSVDTNQPWACL